MPFDNLFDPQRSGIMANFLKALQAYSAVQQIKGDQQDRQFRQDNATYERGLNERQFARQDRLDKFNQDKEAYDQKRNNFADTVSLTNAGAQRGDPKYVDAISKVFGTPKTGRRQSIAAPTGETYYMPTQKERENQTLEMVLRQGELGTALEMNRAHLMLPYVVAGEEAKARFHPKAPPAPHYIEGDNGTVSVVGQNPSGAYGVLQSLPGIGKTKSTPAGADPALAAEAERKRVQGIIDQAKQAGETVKSFEIFNEKNPGRTPTAEEISTVVKAKARMTTLWQQAAREAALAAQKHGDYLEGGTDPGGYAFIQPRRR